MSSQSKFDFEVPSNHELWYDEPSNFFKTENSESYDPEQKYLDYVPALKSHQHIFWTQKVTIIVWQELRMVYFSQLKLEA